MLCLDAVAGEHRLQIWRLCAFVGSHYRPKYHGVLLRNLDLLNHQSNNVVQVHLGDFDTGMLADYLHSIR